jgi:hypothetical protein
MTTLDRVWQVLTDQGIPCALIGAAALAARGVARSTYDIDLLVADPRVLDPNLWTAVRAADTRVDIRRGDIDDPLGGVVRIEQTSQRPVDVVLGKHAWQREMLSRAEPVPGGPPVVLPSDLVLLKLYAGGPQDLWDIRELLNQPGMAAVVLQVDERVAAGSPAMRELWATMRGAARL